MTLEALPHILGTRPDYVIEVRADIPEEIDGPMVLPRRRADRPDHDLVEERYEILRTAG